MFARPLFNLHTYATYVQFVDHMLPNIIRVGLCNCLLIFSFLKKKLKILLILYAVCFSTVCFSLEGFSFNEMHEYAAKEVINSMN